MNKDRKNIISEFILPTLICIIALFSLHDPELPSIGEAREGYYARYTYYDKALASAESGDVFFIKTEGQVLPMESEWEDPGLTMFSVALMIAIKKLSNVFVDVEFLYEVVNYAIFAGMVFMAFSRNFTRLLGKSELGILAFFFVSFILPFQFKFIHDTFTASDSVHLVNFSITGRYPKTVITVLTLLILWKISAVSRLENWYIYRNQIRYLAIFAGLIASVRGDAGMAAVIYLAVITFCFALSAVAHKEISKQKLMKFCLLQLVVAWIILMALSRLPELGFLIRDIYYNVEPSSDPGGHPVWHVLLIGMGHLPNSLGLAWNDGAGFMFIKEYFPNVDFSNGSIWTYGTAGYEQLCKKAFFELLVTKPTLFFSNCFAKALLLLDRHSFALTFIVVCSTFICVKIDRNELPTFLGWACTLGVTFMVPVLTSTYIDFYLDGATSMYLISLILLLILTQNIVSIFLAKAFKV